MIHALPSLQRVTVIKRPSATIKSPYVADICLEDGTHALCHTPGLSCCGLVSPGRIIYVSASSPKSKTAYTAQVSECNDSEGVYYVGIHPMVSQTIAGKLLNRISAEAIWKSEVKVNEHTRLDFVGILPDGKKIYVEVKNAMISMSEEGRATRRAVFPEGFRKSLSEPVSPRAIKHAETLGDLARESTCYLVFTVPRNDCSGGLELNTKDPAYCKAVRDAMDKGVIVRAFGLNFMKDGTVEFDKELVFHRP